MKNSLVSIVTPSYNSKSFIRKTIESVTEQSYQNWEMIIADDCSTDGSFAHIGQIIQEEDRILLLKLDTNIGAAKTRNKALSAAKGRYIAFLDADDVWHPDKLERQLAFMQAHNAAFSFTAYNMVDERSGEIFSLHNVPPVVTYGQLLKSNIVGCSTVIYDTQKLGKILFPIIRKRQDFALWLAILKQVDVGYGLNEPLTDYTVRISSVSSNKFSAALYTWRVYRDIEKLPPYQSLYYFTHYLLKGVKKYWAKG